ncbi:MAG: hypothetical protein LBD11_03140 [Candidatus Peribacteria bacterium]|jgi:hypothetical protein|nr:hypothetical protein [Candidatus Peribacteria bacterium]
MEELRAIKESFLEEVSALDDQDRDGEDRLYSSYVSEVSNIADRVMDIR